MAKKVYVGVENFKQRNLPYGYTQIECIQSSGTQYINTGVTATANTTAKYKYSIDQILTYGPHVLSGQSWYFPMVRGITTGGTFVVNRGGNEVGSSAIAPKTGVIYEVDASFINNKVTVNGVEYGTYAMGNVSVDTAALHLMTYGGSPGDSQFTMNGKLYYCQIYENGTLLRDFIPAKNSAGTIGLYDLANGVFYTNAGSGAFTEGASYKSVARQGKKMYVGIDNVARKVKKGYIGIGGVARPFMGSGIEYYSTITGLRAGGRGGKATHNEAYAIFLGGITNNNTKVNYMDAWNSSLTKTESGGFSVSSKGLTHIGQYALAAGGITTDDNDREIVDNSVTSINGSLTKSGATVLSSGRATPAGTHNENYAIFAGGQNAKNTSQSTVDAYNSSLTRSTPTALSVARHDHGATHVGEYALFAGGNKSNTTSGYKNTVDAYNASLTRSTPTTLSVARRRVTGTHMGNFALFAGGKTRSNNSDVVDVYDTSLTRSTTKLSSARDEVGATHLGDFAIFAGGSTTSDWTTQVTTVDSFDSSLTLTSLRDLTSGLGYSAQAATIGNYALIGGGGGFNKYTSVDTFISL